MQKLLEKIVENNISPNGLYLLYCIENKNKPKHINENLELRLLVADGFINSDFEITDKGNSILDRIDASYEISEDNTKIKKKDGLTKQDKDNIVLYREMFPKGNLPSGSPSRISVKELEKKFLWFLKTYEYSWETILKATKKYISQYEPDGYKFMKNSGYFISKTGLDRNPVSALANYCDMVLDGDDIVESGPSYNQAI